MRPASAVAAAVLAALLSACGGGTEAPVGPTSLGDQSSVPQPAAPSAVGDTATEEPADPATQTEAPPPDAAAETGTPPPPAAQPAAGEFDDDDRVDVVLEWAEEYARAATESDPDREDWLDTMEGEALADRMLLIEDDLGWRYPGPLPLTVIQVVDRDGGAAAAVEACVVARGFATDPQTGSPPEEMVVYPMEFHLRATDEDRDDFVITGIYMGNQSCNGIQIEGRPW